MRNPKFKKIHPNYRKKVLEIILSEQGRKQKKYQLPFTAFHDLRIGTTNRFQSIMIEKEFGNQVASFVLQDGSQGDFPSDLVLYHCDSTYDWSPLNQIKRVIKEKLSISNLSIRVVADAMRTSPSQVVRLLQENKGSKQLSQLFQLAELAGYRIDIQLTKKTA